MAIWMLLLTCSHKSYLPEMQIGCNSLAENPPWLRIKSKLLNLPCKAWQDLAPRFLLLISSQRTFYIFIISLDSSPRSSWVRMPFIWYVALWLQRPKDKTRYLSPVLCLLLTARAACTKSKSDHVTPNLIKSSNIRPSQRVLCLSSFLGTWVQASLLVEFISCLLHEPLYSPSLEVS